MDEPPAATADMVVLPGVLGSRTSYRNYGLSTFREIYYYFDDGPGVGNRGLGPYGVRTGDLAQARVWTWVAPGGRE